ncbi:hypothetical protein COS83_03775 [archaeon CG07_land_8_20_14_0_80_38_8]|nr:MAG: hypothetical protein COS83_03775 [archaeon CG07_land_8_20_14_0_80_38_8]
MSGWYHRNKGKFWTALIGGAATALALLSPAGIIAGISYIGSAIASNTAGTVISGSIGATGIAGIYESNKNRKERLANAYELITYDNNGSVELKRKDLDYFYMFENNNNNTGKCLTKQMDYPSRGTYLLEKKGDSDYVLTNNKGDEKNIIKVLASDNVKKYCSKYSQKNNQTSASATASSKKNLEKIIREIKARKTPNPQPSPPAAQQQNQQILSQQTMNGVTYFDYKTAEDVAKKMLTLPDKTMPKNEVNAIVTFLEQCEKFNPDWNYARTPNLKQDLEAKMQ